MIGEEPNNTTPLQRLCAALQAKAKSNPKFRFYSLYDKVFRSDVLNAAWERSRANAGKPGVDNQTFADIEKYGVERFLGELAEELKTKRYEPQPVRRAYIAKPDGKRRPLALLLGKHGPRYVTGWCKPPCSSSWSQSSRPTFRRSNTPIARTEVQGMRCSKCISFWTTVVAKWWMPTSADTSIVSRMRNS